MADDPTLGFQVDTSGLDKGTQSLDKLTQSAQQTEQQATKTADAINKMGSGSNSGSLNQTAQSADQLAQSLVKAATSSGQFLNATQALETIVAKTGVSYTAANAALQAATQAHNAAGTAAKSHAEALGSVATAANNVTPSISSLANLVGGAGGGLVGGLGALSGVIGPVGIGLGAIAAAAAIAEVALQAVADKTNILKDRFGAVTGSVQAGSEAIDRIKQVANASITDFTSLASAAEKASQGVDKLNTSWPVISVNANKVGGDIAKLTGMFDTLGKADFEAGASAQQIGQMWGTLAQGIAKTGGLTADTFNKLRDEAPAVARTIASAFGVTDLNQFETSLQTAPKSLQDLEQAIQRIKPAIDANFDPTHPRNWGQAIGEVKIAWQELLDTLANSGALNSVTTVLQTISGILKQDAADVAALAAAFSKLGGAVSNAQNQIGSIAQSGVFGGGAEAGASISAPNTESQTGGIISPSSVQDGGAFATGGSFTVGGSGGTDSQTVTFKATPGEVVSVTPPGGTSSSGSSSSGTDSTSAIISAVNSSADKITAAIAALGSGVSSGASTIASTARLTGAGTGTTALPWPWNVALGQTGSTSGGGGGGGGGAKGGDQVVDTPWGPMLLSANDKKTLQDQGLLGKGGSSSGGPQLSKGAGAGDLGYDTATGAGIKGYSQTFPGAAGGATTTNPLNPFDGLKGVSSVPPIGTNPFTGKPLVNYNDAAGLQDIKNASQRTAKGIDDNRQAIQEGTQTNRDVVGQASQDQISAGNANTGSLSGTFEAVGGAIQQAVESLASAVGGGGASGGGGSGASSGGSGGGISGSDVLAGANSMGYSGSGGSDASVIQQGAGSGGYYNDAAGFGEGTGVAITGAIPIPSGVSSLGAGSEGYSFNDIVDPGPPPPPPEENLGYNAIGGQYIVRGSGGRVDSQLVKLMASPGEVVTITPRGMMPPPSPGGVNRGGRGGHYGSFAGGGQFAVGGLNIPGARVTPNYATVPGGRSYSPTRTQGTGSTGYGGDTRNVNIYVQQGVTADTIIRSRAQIARALAAA